MKEMNISNEIPKKIKETVRNRDLKRCVICGTPIFEYYPTKAYFTENPHKNNVLLLCPKHVEEARKGILSEEDLEKARLEPFKPEKGKEKNYEINFISDLVKLHLGNNQLLRIFTKEKDSFAAIKYRNFPIIKFEKGKDGLELSICMIDDKNNIILLIIDNEVVLSNAHWDISYVKKNLKIEDKQKKYALNLYLDSENNDLVLSNDSFIFNGKKLINIPISKNPFEKPNILSRMKGDGIVIG